jgi:hypothetical protein
MEGGHMKKISCVSPLAVIIAMVIVLGLIAGSMVAGQVPAGQPLGQKIMPWAIVVAIVVLSFLIFFVIEKKMGFIAEVAWIITGLFAVVISFVLFYLGEHSLRFEFGFIPTIIAILLSLGLSFLYLFIGGSHLSSERSTGEWGGFHDYFSIDFKLFDEKTKQPISDALIVVSGGDLLDPRKGHTDPSGYWDHPLKRGEYNYSIESVERYKSKSEAFSVESDSTISIPLTKRTGNLVVQVKDSETGNPIQGANVNVSGAAKTTDEQGKALFSGLSIGAKEIIVDEITGVYSSGRITGVIEEDATTETSVSIKSLLQIPTDKRSKLKALGSQLQDNYRRVSTYDPCIPFYYKSSVDNMVNLIEGMVDEPMLFVGAKNPGDTIGYLVDAVDLASREITEVMTSKRNVDVYSAAMSLEKAEVKAKPVGFGDSRVKDYIQDADDFHNSYYHTVQSKLFNIDTTITRKTGELNVLPVSGLWRVSRTLLNETASSSADSIKKSAMLLIADFILDYADDMLREPKIIERLKLMVI